MVTVRSLKRNSRHESKKFPFFSLGTDRLQWNEFLSTLNDDNNSYFKTTWLYAECYMYRKLKSFFEETYDESLHDVNDRR